MPENRKSLLDDDKENLGSRILEVLGAGARGYADGARGGGSGEGSFARNFASSLGTSLEEDRAKKQRSRLRAALGVGTPEFEAKSTEEKAYAEADPMGYLAGAARDRREASERKQKEDDALLNADVSK